MPKISIIIPTYNRETYLCEAIDSVLAQTYKDFEIIVVDDGSTDETKNVLRRYGDKIRYFYQQSKGVSAARNSGIKAAKGEYVAFLDSDDIWLPEKLQIYLDYFKSNPEIPFICARMGVIDEAGKVITGRLKPEQEPGMDFKGIIEKGSCSTSTFMIRRDILNSISFDEELAKLTDLDFCLKIAKSHKILTIDDILTLYREHALNSCANIVVSYEHQIKFWKKVMSEHRDMMDIRFYKNKLARLNYILAREYFRNKNFEQSFKCASTSIHYDLLAGRLFWQDRDTLVNKLLKLAKPYGLVITSLFFRKKQAQSVQKVLFYESSSGYGGSANALVNLVKFLDKKRFSPIVALKNRGAQIDRIKDVEIIVLKNYGEPETFSNLKFFFHFMRYILPETAKLLILIKQKSVDLIHINNNIIAGIPAIIASKISGIPCICHIRQTRKLIRREKIFSKWVNKFIVLNKAAYEMLKEDLPEEKLSLIYDGIDLGEFSHFRAGEFRKEFNLNSCPAIGLIGRIVKGKGHKEFVLAAQEVLKLKPNAKFLIIGDSKSENDGLLKELKGLVEVGNLSESVIFTGWRTDINNIISDLDILIQPATSPEGFGLTIVEAMALKKPVIASNIPGPSEIVVDGETGFLVSPGDIRKMSEKIIYLLEHPDISKRMGENGRQRVEDNFNVKNSVEKIQELYSFFKK